MATCDRCGAENDPGARFCPACGAPRASQRSTGLEARKTVTILFCDTVGSTALGEATDPETTRRVMSRYADTMIGIVRDHGGTVERFRGDEVMAVFGVPAVHEDDALRAVRAGTAMQRALGRLNEDLDARFGVELTCRIGINTGEVVAGDPATAETFVTGDAVNLAKRLEQVADPGGIMIGTSTYALVKDAVKVGPRETFSAKGKSADVGRLRLEDVDASSAGYARRLDAPLVGRATELDQLLARIDTLFDEHRCGIVSLVGPAGVGKSRLSQEVVARYGEQARVASGRCLAYGSGITYWPLVELVRDLGGLAAVGRLLPATDDTETALEQVRAAIGESELTSPSDELFWGVRRMLEGLARERPLLVCLEDIHWAEPTMLDLVEYVAAFGTGPIALLCNARHELLEERPTWSREALVELSQLSEVETHELVGALGIDDPEARRTIASTAEGNPLFAEQLAAMVLESGPGSGGRLALPASIHALLAARLDGLDPAERRVLQRASIVGKEFWYRAVADLSPATDRPAVPSSLLSLSRKGLVTPVREDGATADTYRFHHTLIRDVAYAGIPKGVRAELHEGFAEWLESQPGGFGEHEEIVGYHVEQAQRYLSEVAPGDERALALARRAAGLLGEAGRRAFARDDTRAATNLLGRAVTLMTQDNPALGQTLFELSGALWSTGERARADETLGSALAVASASGDERLTWHARLERTSRHGLAHEHDAEDLLSVAEEARAVFERTGDGLGLARAWRRIAVVHLLHGRFGRAVEADEQALEHAARVGHGREESRIVDTLCTALLYGPVPADEAIARCEELLERARGRPALEAAVLSSLAGLVAMRCRFDEARDMYRRARRLWEELGLRYAVAGLTQVGGEIELLAGCADEAERELRVGAEILEPVGGAPLQSALLARALARQGQVDQADALALRALDAAGGHEIQAEVIALATRAAIAAADGRDGEALALAQAAVGRSQEADAPNLHADALVALARCHAAGGRTDDSATALHRSLLAYAAKGNLAATERLTRAGVSSLSSA